VIAHAEFWRNESPQVFNATVNVEDARASFATKMVMMRFPSALVADGFTCDFNRFEPTLFDERRERAINGSNA